MQQKLAHKVMCIGEHVTGIVGCFAFYHAPNLLPYTISKAHSVKHVKLADIASPQKPPPEVVARKLFEA